MTFPLISLAQLNAIMTEEMPELGIREDDFTNPQRARWINLYMKLLSYITGDTLEQLSTSFLALSSTDNMEFHQEGIGLVLLSQCLQQVLHTAGIEDFSINDINHPTKKRLVRVMSAIVNYYRYKLEHVTEYNNIMNRIDERMSRHSKLTVENDEILRQINDIKAARAEEADKVVKAREERDAKAKHLIELEKQAAILQQSLAEKNAKSAELKADMAKNAETIEQYQAEVDRLDSLIVHSPERAAQEQVAMETQLAQMKLAKGEKLHRLAITTSAHQLQRSQECQQACKLIDGIYEAKNNKRQMAMEKKRLMDEQQLRRADLADLDAKLHSAQRAGVARQERLDKQILQQQFKEDANKMQLRELHRSLDKQGLEDSRVRVIEEERHNLQQKMLDVQEEFKQRAQLLQEDRANLLRAFSSANKLMVESFSAMMAQAKLPGNMKDSS